MWTWIASWLLFPVLLVALALGLGLLAERLTKARLAPAALVAVGLCGVVVLTSLLTASPLTVPIAGPALLLLSVTGWLAATPSLVARARRRWSSIAAVATFACYAAPVAFSGGVSWGGFIKLDDTADWAAIGQRLATEGHTTTGLPNSTYGVLLRSLMDNGYPMGSFADLGVLARLTRIDAMWLLQPLMATLAAGLAYALYAATAGVVRSPVWRAIVAFVAATSTLLLGYTLWGGLKEITLALVLATCCVLLPQGGDDTRPLVGQAALFALPMAAVFVIFGVAGGVYLLPLALAELVLVLRRYGWRPTLPAAGVFLGAFLLLSIPNLVLVKSQLATASASPLGGAEDIGNLFAPLRFVQVFGVWLTGDFRAVPPAPLLTWVLIALVAIGMVGGVAIAARRGRWTVPVFVGMSLLVSFWSSFNNAWLEGKFLAVASPATLLAAGVAFAGLVESGRRFEGLVLVGLVGGGVLASNVMAYREVWIAPSDRMQELAAIGASRALPPALMLEYNPPAARYLLRDLDAEAAGELRWNLIPMNDGQGLAKGAYADIDDFPISSITPYRTLVLRNELISSRPTSLYSIARPGTFYDVWAPQPGVPQVLRHWPVGTHADPAAPAPCAIVREAIKVAGPQGRVAVADRAPVLTVPLTDSLLPDGWAAGSQPGSVSILRNGSATVPFTIDTAGRYQATLGGSLWAGVTLEVDGTVWWSDQNRLNWSPYSNPLPPLQLAAGKHLLTVTSKAGWRPGTGHAPSDIGPVVLSTGTYDVPVRYVESAKALSLCKQRVDWIEAVAR
jgi:hypothetical protein